MPKRQYTASVVYGLIDPRDRSIRYIGVTTDPRRRLSQHLRRRSNETIGLPMRLWLEELAGEGLAPEMVKLENVDGKTRHAREGQWIYFGRSLGWDLLNTLGGTLPATA